MVGFRWMVSQQARPWRKPHRAYDGERERDAPNRERFGFLQKRELRRNDPPRLRHRLPQVGRLGECFRFFQVIPLEHDHHAAWVLRTPIQLSPFASLALSSGLPNEKRY